MERAKPSALRTVKKLLGFLGRRQKAEFCGVLVILVVSAALTQLTPLAVEYPTNTVLAARTLRFGAVLPVLLAILAAHVTNEIIKVARRLLVEDTATHIEKCARQWAAEALLAAPLSYFRGRMTGTSMAGSTAAWRAPANSSSCCSWTLRRRWPPRWRRWR